MESVFVFIPFAKLKKFLIEKREMNCNFKQ